MQVGGDVRGGEGRRGNVLDLIASFEWKAGSQDTPEVGLHLYNVHCTHYISISTRKRQNVVWFVWHFSSKVLCEVQLMKYKIHWKRFWGPVHAPYMCFRGCTSCFTYNCILHELTMAVSSKYSMSNRGCATCHNYSCNPNTFYSPPSPWVLTLFLQYYTHCCSSDRTLGKPRAEIRTWDVQSTGRDTDP